MKHKRSKLEKWIDAVYLLAAIFSIVFLMASVVFMAYSERLNKEEKSDYIVQTAKQSAQAVNRHIQDNFHTLESLGVLVEYSGGSDVESMERILLSLMESYGFVRIGFSDLNGNASWLEADGAARIDVDLAQTEFIIRALAGENVVTNTRTDPASGVSINYYAVPLRENGEIVGLVFAADATSDLLEILNVSLLGGKGFSHVIDQSGDFVVRSDSTLQDTGAQGIFDLDEQMRENTRQQILDGMAAGKAGFIERNTETEKRLASYAPVGINDWYVFYSLPESMIDESFHYMSNGLVSLVTVSILIFIALTSFMRIINEKSRQSLESIVYKDMLTGHRNFQKFLIDARTVLNERGSRGYSLWYCDIKNFKYINDMFGYDVGDNVLKYWADTISEDLRAGEMFGRVDADNFVCLRFFDGEQEARERFVEEAARLESFAETAKRGFRIEMCTGVYVLQEEEGLTVNDMLDRANVAQKSVKALNGSRMAFYSKAMRENILRETEIELKMWQALEGREFLVYMQPKIDIRHDNKLMGMEALVRWNSKEKGLIPPSEFIPLFEKNGFIVELDRYVFEQSCKLFHDYVLESDYPPLIISVNVSRLGILQPDFVESYVAIKDMYGIPDGYIEVEFTESIAFDNHVMFSGIVKALQSHGISCSLDDFGAGHSSLNILKDLTVDVLKLDQLFFRPGLDKNRDRELVKSVVSMAKALNMKTVAEGVENFKTVDFLRRIGCDIVQGYVFAKPMPIDELLYYVKNYDNKMEEDADGG
ncbi:EAL domain-containing protein [Christensenellaceae bacterium OttesenSCG-928-K19]|nr:EAL domain-containing protein [Christensenellaceae bacterium OttesenSCG-928-K19]